jgi:hypothetical protein
MLKINRFNIGDKKQYKGISFQFFYFKIEFIRFGKQFLIRFEITNWNR